jgi:hypothetical protein
MKILVIALVAICGVGFSHLDSASVLADQPLPQGCTFDRGTTTCVSVTTHTTSGQHVEVSGCRYGPNGVPGVRERTFDDTYLKTDTTTTLEHGRGGPVYSSETTTVTTLLGSTQNSDVCSPV